jgi:hypothetical protein
MKGLKDYGGHEEKIRKENKREKEKQEKTKDKR